MKIKQQRKSKKIKCAIFQFTGAVQNALVPVDATFNGPHGPDLGPVWSRRTQERDR